MNIDIIVDFVMTHERDTVRGTIYERYILD